LPAYLAIGLRALSAGLGAGWLRWKRTAANYKVHRSLIIREHAQQMPLHGTLVIGEARQDQPRGQRVQAPKAGQFAELGGQRARKQHPANGQEKILQYMRCARTPGQLAPLRFSRITQAIQDGRRLQNIVCADVKYHAPRHCKTDQMSALVALLMPALRVAYQIAAWRCPHPAIT